MSKGPNHNTGTEANTGDEMLDEYDFSQAIRGNPYSPSNPSPIKICTSTGDRQISIKTVEVTAVVNSNGEVTLQLPPNISPGKHRITLLIEEDFACGSNSEEASMPLPPPA